jgi:hypothetical protein
MQEKKCRGQDDLTKGCIPKFWDRTVEFCQALGARLGPSNDRHEAYIKWPDFAL